MENADEALRYVPSPTTFRISSPWKKKKKTLNRLRPPPLLLLPPRHPPLPHFHHSPSRCSRILQYKPGTDVGRGLAERPRCSGCQPHAFHSEMKAHSSPSCEANFKKKKKKKRGGKKQTLQMSFMCLQKLSINEHTFLSPPSCNMFGFILFFFFFVRCGHMSGGTEKWWHADDENIFYSSGTGSSTHNW